MRTGDHHWTRVLSCAEMACLPSSDRVFGPRVDPRCRSFDFTIQFEDIFFACLPAAVFLLLSLPYIARLVQRRPAVRSLRSGLVFAKLVRHPLHVQPKIIRHWDELSMGISTLTQRFAVCIHHPSGHTTRLPRHPSPRPRVDLRQRIPCGRHPQLRCNTGSVHPLRSHPPALIPPLHTTKPLPLGRRPPRRPARAHPMASLLQPRLHPRGGLDISRAGPNRNSAHIRVPLYPHDNPRFGKAFLPGAA